MRVATSNDTQAIVDYYNSHREEMGAVTDGCAVLTTKQIQACVDDLVIFEENGAALCAFYDTYQPEGNAYQIVFSWSVSTEKMNEAYLLFAQTAVNRGIAYICGIVEPDSAGAAWLDSKNMGRTTTANGKYRYCEPSSIVLANLET